MTQATENPEIGDSIMHGGKLAMEIITDYFEGSLDYGPKVASALKFLPQVLKLKHMEQHRTLVERSQAIRLMPYFKDDETRHKYIRLTQPGAAALLEHRPKKVKAEPGKD
jgi:hypothetical protein